MPSASAGTEACAGSSDVCGVKSGGGSGASCWRRVEARVRVSLTPAELHGGRARVAAARRAFAALLMRYSAELGGVVVAQLGGLRFAAPALAASNPASPFAHVLASATVLVFAPPPRAELVAVVDHVGPDHVGLALLGTFHVVLPRSETGGLYEYDAVTPAWTPKTSQTDEAQASWSPRLPCTVGSTMRFAVAALQHTECGLFHVAATLLGSNGIPADHLGVLDPPVVEYTAANAIGVDDSEAARGSEAHADPMAMSGDEGHSDAADARDSGMPTLSPLKTPRGGTRLSFPDQSGFDDALGIHSAVEEGTDVKGAHAKRKRSAHRVAREHKRGLKSRRSSGASRNDEVKGDSKLAGRPQGRAASKDADSALEELHVPKKTEDRKASGSIRKSKKRRRAKEDIRTDGRDQLQSLGPACSTKDCGSPLSAADRSSRTKVEKGEEVLAVHARHNERKPKSSSADSGMSPSPVEFKWDSAADEGRLKKRRREGLDSGNGPSGSPADDGLIHSERKHKKKKCSEGDVSKSAVADAVGGASALEKPGLSIEKEGSTAYASTKDEKVTVHVKLEPGLQPGMARLANVTAQDGADEDAKDPQAKPSIVQDGGDGTRTKKKSMKKMGKGRMAELGRRLSGQYRASMGLEG